MTDFLYPAIYTKALGDRLYSDGPLLRAFVKLAWRTAESPNGIELDVWQAWLIDRLLERYPPDWPVEALRGRLRYRQVVVSIPRQNGKSVLGAILALYGLLLHEPGPMVVGVASSAEQARIVYNRVLFVIQSNPALAARFSKMTETRGIKTTDGTGTYEIKASKGAALQGLPVSMSVVDELHITKSEIWQSLVNGTVTRANGLVAGITTAGDADSDLLKSLYLIGDRAAEGEKTLERFGFFVWQSPEARVPTDDEELGEYLMASNPALYEGRVSLQNTISDVRGMAEIDVIRYRLNWFVASQAAFIPIETWIRNRRNGPIPPGRPVFAIDRTPDWSAASIVVGIKDGEKIHTEVVASIVRPDLERLIELAAQLMVHDPIEFVVDGYSLKELGQEMKRRGFPVRISTMGDMLTASSLLYAKVTQGKLPHSDDDLLKRQIPLTVRVNKGEGFRISRKDSSQIDGVIATALAVLSAETAQDNGIQIW